MLITVTFIKELRRSMQRSKLKDMIRGWFVGNFKPSAYTTQSVEVGVRKYQAGDYEKRHLHKIATEITVITSGEVEMNNQIFKAGDIITIPPGESTDFKAITDATNVVVKLPGALSDKYEVE